MLWLALSPQPPAAIDTGWDKLNHALAFAALALTGRWGFCAAGPVRAARCTAVLAAALVAVGVGIEGVQAFVPPRSADARDVLADGVGIVAGLLVAAALSRLRRRRPG